MGDDSVKLLDPSGKNAVGSSFNAQSGVILKLTLPPGKRLLKAQLKLGCADDTKLAVEYPALQTDTGPMGNRSEALWLWASQNWEEERVLVGITLEAGPPASLPAVNPPRRSGGRIKLYSRGVWLPLPAMDTLPTGTEQSFPPVTASRLQLESLIEGEINDKRTGVLVPGPLNGKRIGLSFTRQPCHPSVAIGEDAPFFNPGGPLSKQGMPVSGLERAINRYRADHPNASSIPLRIQTANAQALRILDFSAELEPPPAPPPGPGVPPPFNPAIRRTGERLWITPSTDTPGLQRARVCDAQHQAALRLGIQPAGRLSSVSLLLRLEDSPSGSARLALHPDDGGKPGAAPVYAWDLPLAPQPSASGPEASARWYTACLPEAWAGDCSGHWLVCQSGSPGLFWYSVGQRPAAVAGAAFRRNQGAWLPLPDDEWLQVQVGILDPV